jgi:hypothetical protein
VGHGWWTDANAAKALTDGEQGQGLGGWGDLGVSLPHAGGDQQPHSAAAPRPPSPPSARWLGYQGDAVEAGLRPPLCQQKSWAQLCANEQAAATALLGYTPECWDAEHSAARAERVEQLLAAVSALLYYYHVICTVANVARHGGHARYELVGRRGKVAATGCSRCGVRAGNSPRWRRCAALVGKRRRRRRRRRPGRRRRRGSWCGRAQSGFGLARGG